MELLRTGDGDRWIQITVPTGDPDVRRLVSDLKKRGWKRVWTTPMGRQVTQYGVIRMTLINGRN